MEESREEGVFVLERNENSNKGMRVSNFDKWLIAGIMAILFFILTLPFIYMITNKATGLVGLHTISKQGVPTLTGVLIHTVIFIIAVRFLMH